MGRKLNNPHHPKWKPAKPCAAMQEKLDRRAASNARAREANPALRPSRAAQAEDEPT